MLYVNLTPQFRTGAVRSLRSIAPAAENLRMRLFKGASTAVIGAVAGWGAVVAVGAMLVSGASHDVAPSAPAPAVALVAPAPPAPAPIAVAPRETAITLATPPAPAPTKVSQRVDMSPTAAIPDTPKPHKKPHKKKLDNAN